MTRTEAIARLRETKELTTGLLEPLGISFDAWLQFVQLTSARQAQITAQLIDKLSK